MQYIQTSDYSRDQGLCSFDQCPCGYPGTEIPRNEGFIFLSKSVADFRKDCLTDAELLRKKAMIEAQTGSFIFWESGSLGPILICEQGAKKLGIDLEVAAADAKYWWQTGKVPCRPTPLAKKWWQLWK